MSLLCNLYDPSCRPVRFKIRKQGPQKSFHSGMHTYLLGRPKTVVSEIGCLCVESDVVDILPFVAGRHNIFWKIWSTPTIDHSHSCAISGGRNEGGMCVPPDYLNPWRPDMPAATLRTFVMFPRICSYMCAGLVPSFSEGKKS